MSEDTGERSDLTVKLLVLIIAIAAVAGLFFLTQQDEAEQETAVVNLPAVTSVERDMPEPETAPETLREVLAPIAEKPQADTAVISPTLPVAPPPEPLPELHQSDPAVIEEVKQLAVGDKLLKLIVPDSVILKFTRAIIALDEGTVVNDYRPLVSPPPPFKTDKINEPLIEQVGQRYRLSPENYLRYDGMVTVLEELDSRAAVKAYRRFLPLFEEAYAQQGLDTGGFNQVVLRVIDNFLATPIVEEELILVQPKVFYQFQEIALEELPGSQKLLLRMGPENTRRIQTKLREIKALLSM
ncbi:DUF3014 domain-containing protein [Aurantivibrio infirmus]